MTDEIFRQDGYAFEFESIVESVEGDEVILTSTAFYPGGGGQVCDTGYIRGFRVEEVRYKGDDIVHIVPGNDLEVGERAWCSVDWERRYDLMMGHTGEHLLFCSLKRQCPDLEITKIFISPESKYVIVNHDLTWEQIGAALEFANQAIRDNHPVTKSIMDRDDPELENVRIKLDRIAEDEQISVVAIGDIDLSACSGIHVMETSELEMITVDRKVSAGKDGITIEFKVGDEAKRSANGFAMSALGIVETVGCKAADVTKAVSNMRSELELDRRLLKEAVRMITSMVRPVTVGGCDVHIAKLPAADRSVAAEAAESVKSRGGVAAYVSVGDSLSVMVASGDGRVDCRRVLSDVLTAFGGRGGGKPDFAQGGVQDTSVADDVVAALSAALTGALGRE